MDQHWKTRNVAICKYVKDTIPPLTIKYLLFWLLAKVFSPNEFCQGGDRHGFCKGEKDEEPILVQPVKPKHHHHIPSVHFVSRSSQSVP